MSNKIWSLCTTSTVVLRMQQTFCFEKLYSGNEWLYNHEVTVEDGIIQSVLPSQKHSLITDDTETFAAPAFIDFQVYGAAKKLFSLYPTPDTLQTMQEVFSKEGTCLFQPTLATNTIEAFKKAIDAVRLYWKEGGKGVHGLHLEGPWIHPDKRGAHIKEWIHSPSFEEVDDLLAYGKGVIKTITLAPEVVSAEIINLILVPLIQGFPPKISGLASICGKEVILKFTYASALRKVLYSTLDGLMASSQ